MADYAHPRTLKYRSERLLQNLQTRSKQWCSSTAFMANVSNPDELTGRGANPRTGRIDEDNGRFGMATRQPSWNLSSPNATHQASTPPRSPRLVGTVNIPDLFQGIRYSDGQPLKDGSNIQSNLTIPTSKPSMLAGPRPSKRWPTLEDKYKTIGRKTTLPSTPSGIGPIPRNTLSSNRIVYAQHPAVLRADTVIQPNHSSAQAVIQSQHNVHVLPSSLETISHPLAFQPSPHKRKRLLEWVQGLTPSATGTSATSTAIGNVQASKTSDGNSTFESDELATWVIETGSSYVSTASPNTASERSTTSIQVHSVDNPILSPSPRPTRVSFLDALHPPIRRKDVSQASQKSDCPRTSSTPSAVRNLVSTSISAWVMGRSLDAKQKTIPVLKGTEGSTVSHSGSSKVLLEDQDATAKSTKAHYEALMRFTDSPWLKERPSVVLGWLLQMIHHIVKTFAVDAGIVTLHKDKKLSILERNTPMELLLAIIYLLALWNFFKLLFIGVVGAGRLLNHTAQIVQWLTSIC